MLYKKVIWKSRFLTFITHYVWETLIYGPSPSADELSESSAELRESSADQSGAFPIINS